MFVRVVRFTDVDKDHVEAMLKRIEEGEGPPPGVPATRLQVLVDGDQGTTVVLQFYDSAEDMAEGEKVFGAMDPSDTPGTRASVDRCELRLDRRM